MSAQVPALAEVEAGIRAGTYEGFGDEAVALYARIERAAPLFDEPVTFGPHAIDIGSRDGRHHSMIGSLGATRVTAIEPDGEDLIRGIRYGIVRPDETYEGALEHWVAGDEFVPAQAAYLLNMQPRLAGNRNFLCALRDSIVAGGIAVVSCIEPETDRTFWAHASRTSLRLRPLEISPDKRQAANIQPPQDGQRGRNAYLTIWRRE